MDGIGAIAPLFQPLERIGCKILGANMDVNKILVELRQERQQIEEAIISLERLARGRGRRRGRPPAWLSEAIHRRRGRPPKNGNAQAKRVAA